MADEWRITTFAEAPIEIVDGDRGKNYPTQSEFRDTGYCLFLNAGNVTPNGFDFSSCVFISEEKDRLLRKGKLARYDVVLTTRGTVGNSAYFDDSVPYDHIRINSGMVILRAKQSALHPRYLYLFVRSKLFHDQVSALRTGSAQPQLPIRDIQRIEIPIPSLPEQRTIAHILGTLDDKIELNRRTNRTLEAIARAIFKSWFVDFDPVIDNALAAGKPIPEEFAERAARRTQLTHGKSSLPENIRRLFPDEFQDSELGPIPKGWKLAKLGEIISLKYGKALKASIRKPGNVPVYGSNGQVGWHDEGLVDGPGIVVGRKGNPGTVTWVQQGFFPIDTTFYVVSNVASTPMRFLFHALEMENLQSLAADSAVPGLNRNIVYESSILIPSEALMRSFDLPCTRFLLRIESSDVEMRILSEMRDRLLPHLLSGKIELVTERSEGSKT